jgi:hypothetical protein
MKDLARWPVLLAGAVLASVGIGLDLTKQAPIAYGLWALSSACFGAFLYAEGARHREWWHENMSGKDGNDNHDRSEED